MEHVSLINRKNKNNYYKNIITNPLLLMFLLNILFFSKPLLFDLNLSPSDALQRFPSFSIGEFHSPQNSLLFDVITQFHPWIKYVFYDHGNILWNSLNAGGVPFFANIQSAILFPLNIVFLILNLQKALVLFYFLKLYLIGLFSYLFLRELKIGKYESLVGATAFNFAGFNIVWMFWPQTNVILFLPLLFLLIEKLINGSLNSKLFIVLNSVSFCLAVFAGHPETLLHVLILSSSYFLFRLFTDLKLHNKKLSLLTLYSLSAILGLLLSAVQTIPFAEYLFNSYALVKRGALNGLMNIPLTGLIYNLFPNIGGNPSTEFYRPLFDYWNYNELAGGYTGTISLFLAILGIVTLLKKSIFIKYFSLSVLLVIPFIYEVPLISPALRLLSKYIANTRLLFFIAFAQSVVVSLLLNSIEKYKKYKKIFTILISIVFLTIPVVLVGIQKLIPSYLSGFSGEKISGFTTYLTQQILITSLSFIIFLFASIIYFNKPKFKNYYLIIIAFLIFFQTGFANINYNPAIEGRLFFPTNEDIEYLKSMPRGKYIELGGDEILPADTNLYYGLYNISNYDALDLKDYKINYDKAFYKKTSWNTILNADPEVLNRFGVKYVLSLTDINKKIDIVQPDASRYDRNSLGGKIWQSSFIADINKLTGVRILPANFNRLNMCEFEFVLLEDRSKEIIKKVIPCSDVADKIFFDISFPPIDGSKGKHYEIMLKLIKSDNKNAISFWTDNNGNLTLHTIFDEISNPNLILLHGGRFNVFKNETAFSEYYLESDPYSERVKILESLSLKKTLRVKVRENDHLNSTNSFYPGWEVYVDTRNGNLLKSKDGFQSIELEPGEHEVKIFYRPTSFKIGVGISVAGLIVLAGILVFMKYENKN